jgi:hypothetical protein
MKKPRSWVARGQTDKLTGVLYRDGIKKRCGMTTYEMERTVCMFPEQVKVVSQLAKRGSYEKDRARKLKNSNLHTDMNSVITATCCTVSYTRKVRSTHANANFVALARKICIFKKVDGK